MAKWAAQDTRPWDIAAELTNVSKTFVQRQKTGLFKHEKQIIHALDHVSLTLRRGEFAAYAGPNGAGKSTTFKLLCGMLVPEEGDIRVMGLHPVRDRVALMRQVGVFFGGRTELWWDHPVIRSFEWKRDVWGIPDEVYHKNMEKYMELLDVKPFLHSFARELSLGQRMRADLALLLLHSPQLILLDEPMVGLDPQAIKELKEVVLELRDHGVTVLISTHMLEMVNELWDIVYIMDKGRIRATYTREQAGNQDLDAIFFAITRGTDGEKMQADDHTPKQESTQESAGN